MASVYHKGESIVFPICITAPECSELNIGEANITVLIRDRYYNDICTIREGSSMLRIDEETNTLYVFLDGLLTKAMEGMYFVHAELEVDGYKIITNELNIIEIV